MNVCSIELRRYTNAYITQPIRKEGEEGRDKFAVV
jgi:hypothetical protein